jgi:hypothetical protein
MVRRSRAAEPPEQAEQECRHERLTPRWRGPQVMGDDSKAMGYVCHACQREFLSYQVRGRRLIAVEHSE